MSEPKRATVYFEPELHKALRLRAAASDRSISEMVNEAVRQTLAEDAADFDAFAQRRSEPVVDFESFVGDLKRRGRL